MYGVPLLIGIWWVIQFNTRSAKGAFASPSPAVEPRRPLSVSIIGWMNVVGGASSVLTAVAGTPAFLAGLVLTGWRAMVVYVLLGLVGMYIGWGLLMLRERARLLALAWFALSAAHMAFVTLVPPARAQLLAFQRSIGQGEVQPMPFDYATFWAFILVVVVAVAAFSIWFLVQNRGAFQRQPAV